jgi:hypothetical protein
VDAEAGAGASTQVMAAIGMVAMVIVMAVIVMAA